MLIDQDNICEILKELDLLTEDVFVVSVPLFGQADESEQGEYSIDSGVKLTPDDQTRTSERVRRLQSV